MERKYIGQRYVPKIEGEWDIRKNYEPLTIVLVNNTSYTSKKYVPEGIDINNTEFWVITGNYNIQEDWKTPLLINGWLEVEGFPVRYMKDNMGFVHIKGRITGGTINKNAFLLPEGYRPLNTLYFATSSNGAFGRIGVTQGSVVPDIGSNINVELNGLHYKAER